MENNKTELEMKLRRNLRVSAIAMIISVTGLIRAVNRSNIRTVDLLSLIAFGVVLGAFLVTLAMTYRVRKMNSIK